MKLIGIAGKKRAGKDTVASIIAGILPDCHVVHFADALKKELGDCIGTTVSEINQNKDFYRPILQWWGTELRRQHIPGDDNYWIKKLIHYVMDLRYNFKTFVVADVRFPNEYSWVKGSGQFNYIIKIERPGAFSPDRHITETALDSMAFDYTIVNDGTVDQLRTQVTDIIKKINAAESLRKLM